MDTGLTSGEQFLRDAAKVFFLGLYASPKMHLNRQLHPNLGWTPALRFTINGHINVFVEPSESSPYPRILELKNKEAMEFPRPIAVYVACPEEVLSMSSHSADIKRLEADGFGLIVIDSNGNAGRRVSAIPLIQTIPLSIMKEELRGLTPKLKKRVSESFADDYCSKPVNGVRSLTEIVEGLVEQAGKEAITKDYIAKEDAEKGVAHLLDALYGSNNCHNIRPHIGGIRNYISVYRNVSHHWPRNEKKAYEKYANCKHAFLDGVKQLNRFQNALKSVGLSGGLPRT